jgi:hypothetical protein
LDLGQSKLRLRRLSLLPPGGPWLTVFLLPDIPQHTSIGYSILIATWSSDAVAES